MIITSGAYYYDAVEWTQSHEPQITQGISDTSFGTNDPCTRAQIVTFLYRVPREEAAAKIEEGGEQWTKTFGYGGY